MTSQVQRPVQGNAPLPLLHLALVCLAAANASAQIKVGGKEIQVHGFFQQGFAVSSNNNYLTMRTTDGSFAMTDGGLNVSTKLTPRLRIGAQAFSRNIGELGNGRVHLDWAYADYRFTDHLGVRAGKVKTPLGLFNETQDMEFIHTWALLPQSTYPADLRATTIAHVGADLYGGWGLGEAGRLNWVTYGGRRQDDKQGGYHIGLRDAGATLTDFYSRVVGGDARWTTPITGLTGGFSYYYFDSYILGALVDVPGVPKIPGGLPYRADTESSTKAWYADFQRGKWRLYGEYWKLRNDTEISLIPLPADITHEHNWYAAASYRIRDNLELGSYYSSYNLHVTGTQEKHYSINDVATTVRMDVNRFWHVKAEGHFIDGFGPPTAFRAFYPSSNPNGLKPATNMFVLRTGFVF